MKKLFAILFFVVVTTNVFSQVNCQAYFTYNYNPASGTLELFNNSYNVDSTQINITSSYWTVQYGGASYTFTTLNPAFPLNGFTGTATVCLTINSLLCQSTWCDTINIGTNPVDSCIADFSYQSDIAHNYTFTDQSSTTIGNVNSWFWVVTDANTGNAIYSTNNYQNLNYQLPANGTYNVCLTMGTDAGCSSTYCQTIYVQDSMNTGCQLSVNAVVNHVSVIGGNDGSIDLTVTGGTPPYTFNWNTGATTEDINNLYSGIYVVSISTVPACPAVTYTFQILEPFDSLNIIVDTLNTNPIDTCFGFVVDSFYIASISVSGNFVTVEWVFVGGGLISTISVTYTYSIYGNQVVVLDVICGGKSITTYMSYIYISQAMGIQKTDANDQVSLYPNPASDFININFGTQTKQTSTLKIFTNTGQQIVSKTIAPNTNHVEINVANLSAGVYFMQIDNGDGKIIVKKFIK